MRPWARAVIPLIPLAASTATAQPPPPTSGRTGDTTRTVHIIRADRLTIVRSDAGTESYILAGQVELLQGTTRFYCDSAVKDESRNLVEAFGDIHINDADTVHTYAQQLTYLGDTRMATLRRKVRLTDGKGILTTDELHYDVGLRTGTYDKGGRLVNGNSVLTSREGRYNADTKEAYFLHDVRLNDPEYDMTTDTLRYNVDSETATFVAATTIRDGRTVIRTRSGSYGLRTGDARFGDRPAIEDSTQSVVADDIRYDKKSGAGVAVGNVVYRDTAQGVTVYAGHTEFSNADGRLLAFQKPVMVLRQDDDSLYIAADTLYSARIAAADTGMPQGGSDTAATIDRPAADTSAPVQSTPAALSVGQTEPIRQAAASTTSSPAPTPPATIADKTPAEPVAGKPTDTLRVFRAFHRVRIFSDSLQAVCDSLAYSTADSVFRLFRDPILWARGSQVTGDTLYLSTRNQQPHEVTVIEQGFAVSRTPEGLYNQIRGNLLNGYFTDGAIDRLRAKGSAESLYYLQDEDSAYFGLNHAKADAITIHFLNRELKRISWVNGVEGVTYPFRQIPSDKRELTGFKWLDRLRPKSSAELFRD